MGVGSGAREGHARPFLKLLLVWTECLRFAHIPSRQPLLGDGLPRFLFLSGVLVPLRAAPELQTFLLSHVHKAALSGRQVSALRWSKVLAFYRIVTAIDVGTIV